MDWMLLLVVAGGAVAVWRIAHQVRAARSRREEDWDTRLVERLRRGGGIDPFQPVEVDFFVALPSMESAQRVVAALEAEGFAADLRQIAGAPDHPYSVDARKLMQINEVGIRSVSSRLRALADAEGGRYDGWAPGGEVLSAARSAAARPPRRRG
jgi:hypothetical protein